MILNVIVKGLTKSFIFYSELKYLIVYLFIYLYMDFKRVFLTPHFRRVKYIIDSYKSGFVIFDINAHKDGA